MMSLLVLLGIFALGGFLVIFGTVAKNRWGINLDPIVCPCCQTQVLRVRKPTSLHQALWGGFTCGSCSCEIDKWGRQVLRRQP
jgi:hypothetical protein